MLLLLQEAKVLFLFLFRFSFLSKPVDENHQPDGEEDSLVSHFYTNPIAKPIPQTPESAGNKHSNSNSVDDTIVALNMRAALRNGLEGSSEETSFHDESLQDDREEIENNSYHMHPAGQVQIDACLVSYQSFEMTCLLQIFNIWKSAVWHFKYYFM